MTSQQYIWTVSLQEVLLFIVYCAMVDLSKAYDKINISSLCNTLKATYLPGQFVNLIEFKGKNTFVCTFYERCLSVE